MSIHLIYVLAYLGTGICLVVRGGQAPYSFQPLYIRRGRVLAPWANVLLWPAASIYRREVLTNLVVLAMMVPAATTLWMAVRLLLSLALTDHISR